jgi:hypothetical protein
LALPLYAVTLFVSAFLLFLVQPMIGKMILPRLGGTPQVWNTCMVFFQAALLAGYAYTHTVSTRLSLRRQIMVHGVMLCLPIILLLFLVSLPGGTQSAIPNGPVYGPFNVEGFEPPPGANPIPYTMFFLTLVVGLPFFVVSTSAPLLQRWFGFTGHPSARDPYFLYGASNLGSMLSLLCYPFIVEPNLLLRSQSWTWLVGYLLLVAFILLCAGMVWRSPHALKFAGEEVDMPPAEYPVPPPVETTTAVKSGAPPTVVRGVGRKKGLKVQPKAVTKPIVAPAPAPIPAAQRPLTVWRRLRWILLAAAPSSLMLGTITYMSTDLSPIPLLWVLPLALYLLTFILVFARYPVAWTGTPHNVMLWLQPFGALLLCFIIVEAITPTDRTAHALPRCIAIVLGVFFITTMVCHGELARDRPSTRYLTEFYLWMSFGGMLGGLFNGLIAPTLFTGVAEYPLALVAACFLLPIRKEEGWVDGLVGNTFPGLGQWFRETGTKLAAVPLVSIGLIAVLGTVVGGGCAYLVTSMLDLGSGPQIVAYGLVATALITFLAIRFKPSNALAYATDALLGVFIFALAAFLISYGVDTLFTRQPEKNLLFRLQKSLGFSLEARTVFFWSGMLIPLLFAVFFSSRPLRFGAAVGAVLLANLLFGLRRHDDRLLYAGRSYFGVLRVFHDKLGDRWGPLTPQEIEVLKATPEQLKAINVGSLERPVYIPDSTYLMHGTTHHGLNYQHPPGLRRLATTYYHRKGPTGIIMERLNWFPGPQNTYWADARLAASFAALGGPGLGACNLPVDQIAAAWSEPPYATVGLGTGTMASYARPFQHMTFYEIDNTIRSFHLEPFASDRPFFNYLGDALKRRVALEVIMGDARQSLARPLMPADKTMKLSNGSVVFAGSFLEDGSISLNPNRENYYHVIELDAFSSDAIPVHLITKQAIEMYFDKLVENGVLCVHTSNRHVDLVTPVVDIANKMNLSWRVGKDAGGDEREGRETSGYRGHFGQEYVMLARHEKDAKTGRLILPNDGPVASDLTGQDYMTWSTPAPAGNPEWTDDYSNLAGALREQLALWIFVIVFVVVGVLVALILMVSKSFER